MDIDIFIVDHPRYVTAGDWYDGSDGKLFVAVTRQLNPKHEILLAVHEMVEALLCKEAGITAGMVDKWDMVDCKDSEDRKRTWMGDSQGSRLDQKGLMMGILYQLTFPSGKSYIGITSKSLEKRSNGHVVTSRSKSKTAVSAFGTLSPGGYNLSFGGDISPLSNPEIAKKFKGNDFAKGSKHERSKEYRKKLSIVLKGNQNSLGNNHGIGNKNAAGKRTAQHCENIKAGVAAAKAKRLNHDHH